MSFPGAPARVLLEPAAVLGRFAAVLASGDGLPTALELLVGDLGLLNAVVRRPTGELLAVTGSVLHAVPAQPTGVRTASLEFPVPGRCALPVAVLTVTGGRPSHLPVLRAAAAVLGLALDAAPSTAARDLLDGVEQERDELADELHDGPVQALVAARWAADCALRGGDPQVARDAVQLALVEVRWALWHLRPRGRSGLGPALTALAGKVVEAGGPTPVLRGIGGPAGQVTGTVAMAAYRVVQAVARPDAGPVRLDLRVSQARLVAVLDGGADLIPPERWAGRVAALGGELSCASGRTRLDLPIPEPRNAL